MNGTEIISRLKRLGDVNSVKDINQLTAALFPGAHCPLMGAMMAVGGIEDAVLLVLGTDECTYYTKKATIGGFSFKGIDNRCFSVVLDHHDVTFGCREKLQDAFKELMDDIAPKAVFIVTTCVLEVTGDDVDSMAAELEEQYRIPVLPVHTEHFKTANHIPGVRDTVTACVSMMEQVSNEQISHKKVNIIGQRMGKFQETQLYEILVKHNIEIGMMLPGGTTLEDIKHAATAGVNIVVNELGLPLAERMKKRFGTPYVMFDKYVAPEHVLQAYEELFDYLKIEMDEELETMYKECVQLTEDAKEILSGMRYVYGNTALSCYEYNAFMVAMGMEPLLIQTNEYPGAADSYVKSILECYNPYVTKSANIAPLQYVYDELKPNLYLGHEYENRLRAKKIALVHDNNLSSMLGFDVTKAVLAELVRAAKDAKELAAGEGGK
ncbi:MAG: nitrogenase component 1 [Lachnospiraceae bacterium]|nr:nitrogenase component 1 [Lachnospiraceae bacterium]